ncbi:MAG: hypothetical protein WC686_03055 [Candidatus Shapirobacteria bacterium]|jgi:hypothetical protein
MKKIFIPVIVGLLVITGLVVYLATKREKPCSTCERNAKSGKTEEVKFTDYFRDETDLCNILTSDSVSKLLGKAVTKTNTLTSNTAHSCHYYVNDNQAVIVNYDTLNVEKQKQGHELLDRNIVTNPKILMKHFLVIQDNGLINEIYLVVGENEYVSINRTSGKTISEDEMVSFAAKLSEIVSGIVTLSTSDASDQTANNTVPLPQGEDVVRSFLAVIDEDRPDEAALMMATDDSQKQAWAVQFNAISSMKVNKIETTNDANIYKVTMSVIMKPESATAPIPYYGWENGQNVRWVTMVKEDSLWKIEGLATGP